MKALHDRAILRQLLQQHGHHSLAFSTLQPNMCFWGDEGTGYVAYRKTLGQYTFLGDPVCPPDERKAFLAAVVERFPRSLFMQVQRATADDLQHLGFRVTPVGVENDIDTRNFSLHGKRKADLRHYRNRAREGGVDVREEVEGKPIRNALLPVCHAWLPLKSWFAHELEFLARPFQTEPEPGTRIFTGRIGEAIVAFVVLDPMYSEGSVTGYTVTILRHLPDAPEGAVDAIVIEVIRKLAEEDIHHLSLGVSPFHRIEELALETGYGAWPVYLLYLGLRRWGDPIYHFRGLSFHKSRYRAAETPVFTAVPGPVSLWPLYASARACRML